MSCVLQAKLAARLDVPRLHSHQIQGIEALAAGRDLLAICPTGSGKSITFWGAGLTLGGLTLIVSPLRSLIADQCRRLEELGLPVLVWNSDVSDKGKAEALRHLQHGWQGYLYTTAESLEGKTLRKALAGKVTLAAVDEAHCVLKDRGFRVSYAWLGKMLDRIQPSIRMACTATLAPTDRGKLIRSLNLENPEVIVVPIARSNLRIRTTKRSAQALIDILSNHQGQSGIVFVATVRGADALHSRLASQGWPVTLYHGKLSPKQRRAAQAAFMAGIKPVAVATDAFILGIDKSDIRFVAHYDPPKSIEDWVQGFGRAGRDGKPANVYACFADGSEGWNSREFLINATYPSRADLREVWDFLRSAPYRSESQARIARTCFGPRGKYIVSSIFTALQRHHLARGEPNPQDGRRKLWFARGEFDDTDWTAYEAEHVEALGRFEQLRELAALPDAAIPSAIDDYFGNRPHDILNTAATSTAWRSQVM